MCINIKQIIIKPCGTQQISLDFHFPALLISYEPAIVLIQWGSRVPSNPQARRVFRYHNSIPLVTDTLTVPVTLTKATLAHTPASRLSCYHNSIPMVTDALTVPMILAHPQASGRLSCYHNSIPMVTDALTVPVTLTHPPASRRLSCYHNLITLVTDTLTVPMTLAVPTLAHPQASRLSCYHNSIPMLTDALTVPMILAHPQASGWHSCYHNSIPLVTEASREMLNSSSCMSRLQRKSRWRGLWKKEHSSYMFLVTGVSASTGSHWWSRWSLWVWGQGSVRMVVWNMLQQELLQIPLNYYYYYLYHAFSIRPNALTVNEKENYILQLQTAKKNVFLRPFWGQ